MESDELFGSGEGFDHNADAETKAVAEGLFGEGTCVIIGAVNVLVEQRFGVCVEHRFEDLAVVLLLAQEFLYLGIVCP